MNKTLLVVLGPTGVGKTALSLALAERVKSPIISADSRQIFRELSIGTASPTAEELARVPHHFIATRSIHEPYSAGKYEEEALALIETLFAKHDLLLLVGGSMMYIDAVCNGFDAIPDIQPELRAQLWETYAQNGLEWLHQELQRLDPIHFSKVDTHNHKRMLHAVEVSLQTGRPYSSFCTAEKRKRPFNIVKIGLNRPRPELYERINARVDTMMELGLLAEATPLFPHRALNSLNTVGYKELFSYLNHEWTLEQAVQMIKQNSRRYAKRQLTWFNADKTIHWFHPDKTTVDAILQTVPHYIC